MKLRREEFACCIVARVATALLGVGVLSSVGMAQLPVAGKEEDHASHKASAATGLTRRARYGQLPLGFEPNVGQTDPRVKFLSRGQGYLLFFVQDQAVISLRRDRGRALEPSPVRQPFQTANKTEGEEQKSEYHLNRDQQQSPPPRRGDFVRASYPP